MSWSFEYLTLCLLSSFMRACGRSILSRYRCLHVTHDKTLPASVDEMVLLAPCLRNSEWERGLCLSGRALPVCFVSPSEIIGGSAKVAVSLKLVQPLAKQARGTPCNARDLKGKVPGPPGAPSLPGSRPPPPETSPGRRGAFPGPRGLAPGVVRAPATRWRARQSGGPTGGAPMYLVRPLAKRRSARHKTPVRREVV